jgi:hypothetical protein
VDYCVEAAELVGLVGDCSCAGDGGEVPRNNSSGAGCRRQRGATSTLVSPVYYDLMTLLDQPAGAADQRETPAASNSDSAQGAEATAADAELGVASPIQRRSERLCANRRKGRSAAEHRAADRGGSGTAARASAGGAAAQSAFSGPARLSGAAIESRLPVPIRFPAQQVTRAP